MTIESCVVWCCVTVPQQRVNMVWRSMPMIQNLTGTRCIMRISILSSAWSLLEMWNHCRCCLLASWELRRHSANLGCRVQHMKIRIFTLILATLQYELLDSVIIWLHEYDYPIALFSAFLETKKVSVHMTNTSTEAACLKLIFTAVWTRISCRWQTHVTRCIMANVLQTNKVDAQCDKLATELSWQHFASNVANFQLLQPHLHLVPPLGVSPFEFCRDFLYRKLKSLGYHVALLIQRLAISVEHRPVTDGWTDTWRQLIPALPRVARVKRCSVPARTVTRSTSTVTSVA